MVWLGAHSVGTLGIRSDCLGIAMTPSHHLYDIRPRKDHRGVDLISDVLPFGRLWYGDANAVANAVGYAQHLDAHTMPSFAFTMNWAT